MAIVIDAQIKMPGVSAGMAKLQSALTAINQSVVNLNAALVATSQLAGQAGVALRQMGGSARFPGTSSQRVSVNQEARGMSAYAAQAAAGNPNAINLFNHYSSMNRAQNKGQMRAQSFLAGKPLPGSNPNAGNHQFVKGSGGSSSGSGGGSLISGTMVALMEIPGVDVVVAGLTALAAAAALAKSSLDEISQSQILGGGSFGQSRSASMVSNAVGVNVGSIGKNLMHGYGPVAAAGAGVNPFGGPFGDNNYNEKGLKVLNWIRNSTSSDQARRRAELAGSPEAAKAYYFNDKDWKEMTQANGGMGSEQSLRHQADMDAASAKLKDDFVQLGLALEPVLVGFTKLVNWIHQLFNGAGLGYSGLGGPMPNGASSLPPAGGKSAEQKSMDANTDATDRNTDAVNRFNGIYGGGERANSGPSKLDPSKNVYYSEASYGAL